MVKMITWKWRGSVVVLLSQGRFPGGHERCQTSLKRPETHARPRRATSTERQIIFENGASLPPRQSQSLKSRRIKVRSLNLLKDINNQ